MHTYLHCPYKCTVPPQNFISCNADRSDSPVPRPTLKHEAEIESQDHTMSTLPTSQFEGMEMCFDYIIIGGGTAGLVAASRLSEDTTVRVLVIEAGRDNRGDPLILTPGLVTAVYGKEDYDWNFSSVPQASRQSQSELIKADTFCLSSRVCTTAGSTRRGARCSVAAPH